MRMTVSARIAQVTVCAALVLGGSVAAAQDSCPEGTTLAGECVDQDLAEASREGAIVYSQPQLSQTHYPILPSGDLTYRYPDGPNPSPGSQTPSPTGMPTAPLVVP